MYHLQQMSNARIQQTQRREQHNSQCNSPDYFEVERSKFKLTMHHEAQTRNAHQFLMNRRQNSLQPQWHYCPINHRMPRSCQNVCQEVVYHSV